MGVGEKKTFVMEDGTPFLNWNVLWIAITRRVAFALTTSHTRFFC